MTPAARHGRTRALIGFAVLFVLAVGLSAVAGRSEAQDGGVSGQTRDYQASQLSVEDFTGTLIVAVGDPGVIKVTLNGEAEDLDDLTVRQKNDRVLIEGTDTVRSGRGFGRWFRGRDYDGDLDDYPTITVAVPKGAEIVINDMIGALTVGDTEGALTLEKISVEGTVGAVASARIGIAGSGVIEIDSVAGDLAVAVAGSGSVRAGNTGGEASLSIAGSGSVILGSLGQALRVSISGSGDVRVGEVASAVRISVSGSGDVTIDEGRADPFKISINGSGDVVFGGTAVDPSIAVNGSGDVRIGAMEGRLRSSGNGDILGAADAWVGKEPLTSKDYLRIASDPELFELYFTQLDEEMSGYREEAIIEEGALALEDGDVERAKATLSQESKNPLGFEEAAVLGVVQDSQRGTEIATSDEVQREAVVRALAAQQAIEEFIVKPLNEDASPKEAVDYLSLAFDFSSLLIPGYSYATSGVLTGGDWQKQSNEIYSRVLKAENPREEARRIYEEILDKTGFVSPNRLQGAAIASNLERGVGPIGEALTTLGTALYALGLASAFVGAYRGMSNTAKLTRTLKNAGSHDAAADVVKEALLKSPDDQIGN
ncbi:MAG: GIN domain-containing protein [Alphaproteobacteria bacterium]